MAFFDNLFGTNLSTTTSTSSSQIPQWAQDYYVSQIQARSNLYNTAQQLYNQNADYPVYTGDRLQGFTADQLAGFDATRNAAGAGTGDLNAARSSINNAMGSYGGSFSPSNVGVSPYSAQYNAPWLQSAQANASTVGNAPQLQGDSYNPMMSQAQNVMAGQMGPMGQLGYDRVNGSNVGISSINPQAQVATQGWNTNAANAYMNPYTDTAMRSALDEIQRRSDVQGVADRARSAKAGAFGGSRQAIMDAERERNTERAMADTAANMQNAAYGQAQNMFTSDAGRQLQAGQFNVGTEFNRQGQNQQAGLQAGLANQSNALQAGLANQQAGINTGQFNINTDFNRQLQNNQFNMQGQLANQQAGLQSSLANQGAYNAAQQYGLGQNFAAQQGNQQSWMQSALANQSALNNTSMANAQMQNAMNQFNGQQSLAGFQANANIGLQNNANSLASQIQNQNMGLQAFNANRDQFNTDATRNLAGAGMYAQLAPMASNMAYQDANALMGIGSLQQNFGQQNMNTAYNDFLMQQQYPYQQYGFLNSALQGSFFNPQFGMSQTSSTTTPGPSVGAQAAGLGIAGLGALGSSGAFGTGTSSGWLSGLGSGISSIGSGIGSFLGGIF